jgi:C4-dicarboxylate-specific signal transduction histidine kinase
MGGATVLATWFTVGSVREELIDDEVENATAIVNNLFHQIEDEYLTPLLERGETYDHADPEHVAALEEVVMRSIRDYQVRKVYFFDAQGLIVYSTQKEHIGFEVPAENVHFHEAAAGKVSWALKRRNDPLDISGDPTREELLETYVPVVSRLGADPGRVAGVIELYQGTDDLRRDLQTSRHRIVAISLISLGAVFLVFTYFIRRAERLIRQRRRELIESNRALAELSRNLESLVEKRTQQLIEKENLASVGSLAAGIAHEINNPLATIAACSEGSAARLRSLLPEGDATADEVFQYLDVINAEAFRLKGITRSLLDYSRKSPISEVAEFDLNSLVDQTLVLLKLDRKNRRVRFETDLADGLPAAVGDAARIRQVIHNLVDNAVYAVREAEDPRVALRTRSQDSQVVFECEDNGPGIPAEIRKRVFDPFFTTKPSREGIGLGLAVSFTIIQSHRGSLELVSPADAGKGALFRFSLPTEKETARDDGGISRDAAASER